MAAERVISWTVLPAEEGVRVDRALPSHVTHASRAQAKRWIEEGRVTIGRRPVRPSRLLHAGEDVRVSIPPLEPAAPAPEPIPLDVVYEDDALLVVNKPAGMVVHPGAGHRTGTLVNALLHHCSSLAGIGGVARPGIVHRLDRGTSGLLVVAKTDAAHRALSRQFAARTVEKQYVALVHGEAPPEMRLSSALGRDVRDRKKISSRARRGKPAVTYVKRVEALPGASLIEVKIETGRTHQIRVHLSERGYPVVGDDTYGRRARRASLRREKLLLAFPRPALHAAALAFDHPLTGERMRFEAPLPDDFEVLLSSLRVQTSC